MGIMMKSVLISSVLALVSTCTIVSAVKDDEYYRAGMGNPNINLKMYWADAHNVLQDLSKFSTLYIQYHSCAWTQNYDHYDGQDEGSGSGDENDYWYLGATPSFAANVAYSLYGSLYGESFSGCNSDTFINSFTTNSGFEAFASALYYAGATRSDYSQSYSSACQGGSGIACDYSVGFASVTYSSDTCDPYYATSVTNNLGYMNSDFQSAKCVKIYDSSHYNSYAYSNNGYNNYNGYNNNNNNGYNNGANNYYYNNGYNNAYNNEYSNYYQYHGTPLGLLYYSNACFIQNFWSPNGGCPDPYGKLQYYQHNFNQGFRKSMKVDPYVKYRANMEKGKKLVQTGAIFFMAAALFYLCEQLLAFRKRVRTANVKKSPAIYNEHMEGEKDDRLLDTTRKAPENAPHNLLHAAEDTKRKRSMVGLVRSATGKMKEAVKTAAVTTMAAITPNKKETINDVAIRDRDGVMVSDKAALVANASAVRIGKTDSKISVRGSYKAPESSPTWDASTIGTHEGIPHPPDKGMGDPSNAVAVEETSSDESAVKVEIPVEIPVEPKSSKRSDWNFFSSK
jgi:hypothetical protein